MRRTRALIARADQGGLGNLTWTLARRVPFDRIAVVEMPEPRGAQDWQKYHGLGRAVQRFQYPSLTGMVEWVAGCDTVYTAETPYDDRLLDADCRVVLHAMPELHRPEYDRATEVWWPTSWLAPEGARIVPVPTDCPPVWRKRTEALRFGIIGGDAMADRNGGDAAMAALRRVQSRITVHAFHLDRYRFGHPIWAPNVTVHFRGPVARPAELYDAIDVLILPRRFGGLSLLVNEAAEHGVPTIHLDRMPDCTFPGWSVRSTVVQPHRMAGGLIDVHGVEPYALARVIDEVAALSSEDVQVASKAARAWAEEFSWDVWAERYAEML